MEKPEGIGSKKNLVPRKELVSLERVSCVRRVGKVSPAGFGSKQQMRSEMVEERNGFWGVSLCCFLCRYKNISLFKFQFYFYIFLHDIRF